MRRGPSVLIGLLAIANLGWWGYVALSAYRLQRQLEYEAQSARQHNLSQHLIVGLQVNLDERIQDAKFWGITAPLSCCF